MGGRRSRIRTGPHPDDAFDIVFFRRHPDDDPATPSPGREALNSWPVGVRAKARSVLIAVAAAPPHRFSGGGYWEAMHGSMAGWFEVRVDGPGRRHYRLFCLLDPSSDAATPSHLVVVAGFDKPFRSTLTEREYSFVREMGREFLSRMPRSLASP